MNKFNTFKKTLKNHLNSLRKMSPTETLRWQVVQQVPERANSVRTNFVGVESRSQRHAQQRLKQTIRKLLDETHFRVGLAPANAAMTSLRTDQERESTHLLVAIASVRLPSDQTALIRSCGWSV